eukprot:scaffold78_cov609-Prasinococcus_capsulatus_cf.AAC.9
MAEACCGERVELAGGPRQASGFTDVVVEGAHLRGHALGLLTRCVGGNPVVRRTRQTAFEGRTKASAK